MTGVIISGRIAGASRRSAQPVMAAAKVTGSPVDVLMSYRRILVTREVRRQRLELAGLMEDVPKLRSWPGGSPVGDLPAGSQHADGGTTHPESPF